MKYHQVNIPAHKPIFTNSKKIKRQLEKNAKAVVNEIGFKVYWDKDKYPIQEKIAALLKHDSQCAVEKIGVCDCYFYDVANRLVELFEIEKKSRA